MSLEGKLEIYGLTDVGRKRSHNEDSIGSDTSLGLLVLADGMGGYKAGEVASAIAVNMILEEVRAGLKRVRPGDTDDESGFSRESMIVRDAIEHANQTIFQTAQSQPQCHGMGTTVVTAAFYDNRMTVAHVGDSRLYRMREARLEQVTSDHSLLQELVDKGFYTPEEARKSLNKNLVTRAMGIEREVVPDVQEDMVLPGDVYLLCSDGLTDQVEDEEIGDILRECRGNLEEAARTLVQRANEMGGKDNISVILARTLKPFKARKSWYSRMFDWF
ncbi:MAG: Stp1/IreP family PP2C-type Ser/Thr phosphatase [Ectothiorhodospiraceae bacterium]|nr:Stp1/IreP family PP2C-type Ser/Thr phosphatase [Chromatiales bacterium]MCP5155009.1 Stp1/IreP family PP2C-type Ser/Thr phosphatase [Ectothiorhodospiraceae bacterium]